MAPPELINRHSDDVADHQLAAQHSHSLEGWYAHIPGLRVLAPATLEDARGTQAMLDMAFAAAGRG